MMNERTIFLLNQAFAAEILRTTKFKFFACIWKRVDLYDCQSEIENLENENGS